MKSEIASFFKRMSRKQMLAIIIGLIVITITSALAIHLFQNQLPIDGDNVIQQRTEIASLLCEWSLSKDKGFFTVNITNQHDVRVSSIMARGQFKNGSLLILELTPPHDTLEPSQSYAINQAGSEKDFENIDTIKAWGTYLVGTDGTD